MESCSGCQGGWVGPCKGLGEKTDRSPLGASGSAQSPVLGPLLRPPRLFGCVRAGTPKLAMSCRLNCAAEGTYSDTRNMEVSLCNAEMKCPCSMLRRGCPCGAEHVILGPGLLPRQGYIPAHMSKLQGAPAETPVPSRSDLDPELACYMPVEGTPPCWPSGCGPSGCFGSVSSVLAIGESRVLVFCCKVLGGQMKCTLKAPSLLGPKKGFRCGNLRVELEFLASGCSQELVVWPQLFGGPSRCCTCSLGPTSFQRIQNPKKTQYYAIGPLDLGVSVEGPSWAMVNDGSLRLHWG